MYKLQMHNTKNQYHLFYDDSNGAGWTFERLQDLFEELNRLLVNKVDIELYILDDNTNPKFARLWKRLSKAARTNGFTLEYNIGDNSFKSTGTMERKSKVLRNE